MSKRRRDVEGIGIEVSDYLGDTLDSNPIVSNNVSIAVAEAIDLIQKGWTEIIDFALAESGHGGQTVQFVISVEFSPAQVFVDDQDDYHGTQAAEGKNITSIGHEEISAETELKLQNDVSIAVKTVKRTVLATLHESARPPNDDDVQCSSCVKQNPLTLADLPTAQSPISNLTSAPSVHAERRSTRLDTDFKDDTPCSSNSACSMRSSFCSSPACVRCSFHEFVPRYVSYTGW